MALRNVLMVIGGLVLLGGVVFLIQGTRLLPFDNPLYSSYMTGDPFWGWTGAIMILVGSALVYFGATMPKRPIKD